MKHLGFKWRLIGKLTIIYVLVLACTVIPVTASKYVSEAEGSDSARVARFESGVITYTQTNMPSLENAEQISEKYYAFLAEFQLSFDECEVARQYKLDLNFPQGLVNTQFACPDVLAYTINANDDLLKENVASTLTGGAVTSFESGCAYYVINSVDKNGIVSEGNWKIIKNAEDVLTFIEENIPMGGITYDFKVLFFVKVLYNSNSQVVSAENSFINYDLTCEQVD